MDQRSTWEALLRDRRSVRDFRPDPIPEPVLAEIIGDALASPSWSNTQPYLLGVASGPLRDRISEELCARFDAGMRARSGGLLTKLRHRSARPRSDVPVPHAYPSDLQERRRATGYGLYRVLGIDRGDRAARDRQMRRNFEFFGAPTVVFVFVHRGLGHYATLDAGIMLHALMLAATARGLGTCAQGALALWAPPVRAAFEVPDHYALLCGVAIGSPSPAAVNSYAPQRAGIDQMVLPVRSEPR
ncbi:MAG: nitroreductase, partial [Actinomycetales bacterium]|nr:nitroreductase [Actinomycetales bacterium]